MRFPSLSVCAIVIAAISWQTATSEAWTTPRAASPREFSTLTVVTSGRVEGQLQQSSSSHQESQHLAPVARFSARRDVIKGSAMALGWWALGGGTQMMTPAAANAYERRDVGGVDRSPETAALNEMAFLTNNRLERAGFQLETAAEQSASLTSALSGMSYEDTAKSNKAKSTASAAAKKSSASNNSKKPKKL